MKVKKLICLVLLTVLAVSPIAVIPWSERAWVSESTDASFRFLYPICQLGYLAAGLFVLWRVIRTLGRNNGKLALGWMVLVLICFLSCIVGFRLSRDSRMQGMSEFAERSQALITAIKEFDQDQGQPPESLADLVPTYLSAVPETGMPAYPEYVYYAGNEAQKRYVGNSWALIVNTPFVCLNWDQMLYFPQQNYSEVRYSAGLERVGDWAYNHE